MQPLLYLSAQVAKPMWPHRPMHTCDHSISRKLFHAPSQQAVVFPHRAGGCGRLTEVKSTATGAAPKIFAVDLGWQSSWETTADIVGTLAAVTPFIKPCAHV